MSQAEDIAAIYNYFKRTSPTTPEAARMRTSFLAWHDALSWYNKNLVANTYADARAKRTAFNAANKTPEIPGGMTTEQMQMEPSDRTTEIISQQRTSTKQAAVAVKAASGRKTIRIGSRGPDVGIWQNILNIRADNIFGAGTKTRTIAWQKAHGLVGDGIVGPKTWAEAAADAKAKSEAAARKADKLLKAPAPPAVVPKKTAPKTVAPKAKPKVRRSAPRRTAPVSRAKPKAKPKAKPAELPVKEAGYGAMLMNLPIEAKVAGAIGLAGAGIWLNERGKKVTLEE